MAHDTDNDIDADIDSQGTMKTIITSRERHGVGQHLDVEWSYVVDYPRSAYMSTLIILGPPQEKEASSHLDNKPRQRAWDALYQRV